MPRLPRKNLNGSFFHIIVQGINKEYIFKNTNFKKLYKNLFKKNLAETNITVLAYCIMDNHAHILLHTNQIIELTKLMQKTNTSYAKLYNKLNNRVGYVFRDRYFSQMISDISQLFNCVAYIHNNPVKASIVSKPIDYIYSSYKEYIDKKDLITDKSIELVFGKNNNYKDIFKTIHNRTNIDDIMDIKEEPKNSDEVIKKFINKRNITLEALTNNENIFCDLLLELRHSSNLSLRDMSKIFNIDKNKLNKIINKKL